MKLSQNEMTLVLVTDKLNKELKRILYSKPPVSHKSVSAVAKLALHYLAHYEEVADVLLDFLRTSPTEHKLSALYLIDSIVKNSNIKLGKDNNYTQVFTNHLREIVETVYTCPEEDKPKVTRVIRIWVTEDVLPFASLDDIEIPVTQQLHKNSYYLSLKNPAF
eukprot:TRINITY_DN13238_c0_g1_i1.p1 TRINITY_DN13238_c0_g1~~TRINITY_DN13238_c0_g1_i1.p1  ORF type:complete len:181 (+),score=25.30 TRINITY_DN13238_c0_g1_i1:55-543(+)